MRKPQWLMAEVARQGQRVLDGATDRAEAVAGLTAAINSHPEHLAAMVAAEAEKELTKWLSGNAPAASASQLLLFPEMPLRMRVTPSKSAEVFTMNARQLDAAKHMLWARTQNQMDGAKDAAEHERAVFADFYAKVRPLLAGDLTVADALARIAVAA